MVLQSNAKINLYLRVVGERPDGFHDIETVMVPVGLADELTLSEFGELALECDDPNLPVDSGNLAFKAAELLRKKYRVAQGARIAIKKRIPIGAGLGGGSSNATWVLKGLNRLWDLRLDDAELEEVARDLGSDTAFFVRNVAALGTGRGEKLEPVHLVGPLPVLLVHFGFGSSTAWAYRHCSPGPKVAIPTKKALSMEAIVKMLRNDLEAPVFRKFPILPIALEFLEKQKGVLGARMSGSGSTLFALLESESAGERALSATHQRFSPDVWGCITTARA